MLWIPALLNTRWLFLLILGLNFSLFFFFFNFSLSKVDSPANLSALKDSADNPFPTPAQTCSEGKEADLVFVLLQKRHDPLPHALIPLVDELLAEVAVNLLGRHLLVRWEGGVDKVGQL